MPAKYKECFSYHVVLHSLFGLGLGLLLVALIPSLGNVWLGLILMAVVVVADAMRMKSSKAS